MRRQDAGASSLVGRAGIGNVLTQCFEGVDGRDGSSRRGCGCASNGAARIEGHEDAVAQVGVDEAREEAVPEGGGDGVAADAGELRETVGSLIRGRHGQ